MNAWLTTEYNFHQWRLWVGKLYSERSLYCSQQAIYWQAQYVIALALEFQS